MSASTGNSFARTLPKDFRQSYTDLPSRTESGLEK